LLTVVSTSSVFGRRKVVAG